jgi:hypothetical protein
MPTPPPEAVTDEATPRPGFIVVSASYYAKLLAVKEAAELALEHVTELRDAWMSGAIRECDGKGGTRSNRNVDVETNLRAAIAACREQESPDGQ